MYLSKFCFTFDIDVEKMPNIYEEISNPILAFMKEHCSFNNGDYCFKWEFMDRYTVWLSNNNLPPESKSEVDQFLKERYKEVRRITTDGSSYNRAWSGFSWLPSDLSSPLYTNYTNYTKGIKTVYREVEGFVDPGISGIVGIFQTKNEENGEKD